MAQLISPRRQDGVRITVDGLWFTHPASGDFTPDWKNANCPGSDDYAADCSAGFREDDDLVSIERDFDSILVKMFEWIYGLRLLAMFLIPVGMLVSGQPPVLAFIQSAFVVGACYLARRWQANWELKEKAKGPWLIYRFADKQILLQRHGKTFHRKDVESLQWWAGRTDGHQRSPSLYLLVRENGELIRYLVLSNPQHWYVRKFVRASGIPNHEYTWGTRFPQNAERS